MTVRLSLNDQCKAIIKRMDDLVDVVFEALIEKAVKINLAVKDSDAMRNLLREGLADF